MIAVRDEDTGQAPAPHTRRSRAETASALVALAIGLVPLFLGVVLAVLMIYTLSRLG
jgi:hypothetical protein